jgi:hypothetical protein
VQKCPQVSTDFAKPTALEWLDAISQLNSILSAILAVIHPDLHCAGQETMNRLRQHDKIQPQDVLHQWTSAFNSVSVICNHRTPLHWDGKTRKQWYNLLVTLGRYRNCNLDLPGVGHSLEYCPGTVVGLLGLTLEHAVDNFEGERVCYAYFMRDRVHEWAQVPGKDWMETDYYW